MKIDARYLLEEPELGDAALPDSLELDLPIDGDRVLGEIYLPAGVYEGPHPTVILCHGIPGTNNNDDVAQCLRRMGCVVIRPYHRGAWGSEGIYSFSHCIEDAIALARWAREDVAKNTSGITTSAFRYVDGDPEELLKALAPAMEKPFYLAGSVNTFQRIDFLKTLPNLAAFTIGGAFFEGKFGGTFAEQITKVCRYLQQ